MARIRDFLLTPELTNELLLHFEAAPDQTLESWAKECLKGGYTKAPAIRNRLITMARGGARLEDWVTAMLSAHLPFRSAIRLFDREVIRKNFPELEVIVGRELLLLCLLLDDRPEVVQLGIEQAGQPPHTPPLDYEAARLRLADVLVPALLPLAPMPPDDAFGDSPPGSPGDDPGALGPADGLQMEELNFLVEDQSRIIDSLEREIEDRKARNRHNMDVLVRANKRKLHQLQQQKDQLAHQAQHLETEKTALQKQLHDIKSTQAQSIKEGIRQQTDLLLHKWLEAPLRAEDALEQTAASSADLLARAEEALKAQVRQDRHTGNRIELGQRLANLGAAKDLLAQALQSAIRPLPENGKILRELEEEIARIETVLGASVSQDTTLARLHQRIALATDPAQLELCGQLLDAIEPHELLPATECRKLYAAIQQRFGIFADKPQPRAPAPARPSGWSLRNVLYRNAESLVLIDGYNLLFRLADIFAADFDHGSPGPRARARLVEAIKRLVLGRPKVQTRVCFDGPSARTDHIAPHLRVEFTGGVGDHRADQLILSGLSPKGLSDLGQERFVVTDDRNLRREAEARGAVSVPVNLFAVLLHDFKAL